MKQSTSWSNSGKWYHKIVGQDGHYYHQHVVLPAVLHALDLSKGASLLDVGCGQGVLARAIPQTVEYWGVDISALLISEAKQLDPSPNHHYVVSDATKDLGVTKAHFSHAAAILSLQNMRTIEPVIQSISQALASGGRAVFVLNHPHFRIPRQSGWTIDETQKTQKRWVSRYMSSMEIPILTHPGERSGTQTLSFHRPLSDYVTSLREQGMLIDMIEELVSDKESVGRAAKSENRSRAEIPLFMLIRAVKQ